MCIAAAHHRVQVGEVRPFIAKAFPGVDSVVLDSEILLVDQHGDLLKFGTLGVHKRKGFHDATVALFIFDIMYLNGECVMDKTMTERRELLAKVMTPIPGRVEMSVQRKMTSAAELRALMKVVINRGAVQGCVAV